MNVSQKRKLEASTVEAYTEHEEQARFYNSAVTCPGIPRVADEQSASDDNMRI